MYVKVTALSLLCDASRGAQPAEREDEEQAPLRGLDLLKPLLLSHSPHVFTPSGLGQIFDEDPVVSLPSANTTDHLPATSHSVTVDASIGICFLFQFTRHYDLVFCPTIATSAAT